jgi:hypothetical protein
VPLAILFLIAWNLLAPPDTAFHPQSRQPIRAVNCWAPAHCRSTVRRRNTAAPLGAGSCTDGPGRNRDWCIEKGAGRYSGGSRGAAHSWRGQRRPGSPKNRGSGGPRRKNPVYDAAHAADGILFKVGHQRLQRRRGDCHIPDPLVKKAPVQRQVTRVVPVRCHVLSARRRTWPLSACAPSSAIRRLLIAQEAPEKR